MSWFAQTGLRAQSWLSRIRLHFMDVPRAEREELERFGRLVLADRELHHRLRASATEEAFAALAVRLGAERGCVFGPATVRAALQAERRVWLERWL